MRTASRNRLAKFSALTLLLCTLIGGTALPQQPETASGRYIVRDVEGAVMLIDLQTGWTWKRVAPSESKPPRWRSVKKFSNARQAAEWLEANPEKPLDQSQEERQRWVGEVLLGLEYVADRESTTVVRRWVTSPTVSIFGGSPERNALVVHAIDQINQALKPACRLRLKLVEPNNQQAAIRFRFMQFSEFEPFCRANNKPYSAVDIGCFYTLWDRAYRITEADVLIAVDKSQGNVLKHLVLEELTQALGPMNDSIFRRDSIFFSGRSSTTQLSAEDKQLMLLLYKYLKPGDPKSRIESAALRLKN